MCLNTFLICRFVKHMNLDSFLFLSHVPSRHKAVKVNKIVRKIQYSVLSQIQPAAQH